MRYLLAVLLTACGSTVATTPDLRLDDIFIVPHWEDLSKPQPPDEADVPDFTAVDTTPDMTVLDLTLPDLLRPDLTSDLLECFAPGAPCQYDDGCCSSTCNYLFPADAGVAYCCLPQGWSCGGTKASCCPSLSCRNGTGVPTCLP